MLSAIPRDYNVLRGYAAFCGRIFVYKVFISDIIISQFGNSTSGNMELTMVKSE